MMAKTKKKISALVKAKDNHVVLSLLLFLSTDIITLIPDITQGMYSRLKELTMR